MGLTRKKMGKMTEQELSMQIDSAWQNGMNSDEMAKWLLNTVFAEKWESIESAPKDEQPFLGWFSSPNNPSYGFRAITYWYSLRDEFHGQEVDAKLTHWMPLPEPPTSSKK